MKPIPWALLSACLALFVPSVGRAQFFGPFGGNQPFGGYSQPFVGSSYAMTGYSAMPNWGYQASYTSYRPGWPGIPIGPIGPIGLMSPIRMSPHVIPPSTYQFVAWGIQCLPAPSGETCPTSSRVPILNPNAREDERILFQIIRIEQWRRGYAIYVQAMRHTDGLVTTFVTATSTDAVPPGRTLQSTQATIHLGMTAILADLTESAIH